LTMSQPFGALPGIGLAGLTDGSPGGVSLGHPRFPCRLVVPGKANSPIDPA
jgi:hypothetical protein